MGLFLLSLGSRMGRLSTSALPAARKCLLPCKLDRRPGSCLMVDGHWRCWPDIRAPSPVCSKYSRRLSRSHPLSGGLSLPLISTCTSCCATEEQSASAGSGEQDTSALTTTQARLARGARAELESQLPLPALPLAGRAPARPSFSSEKMCYHRSLNWAG